jgi:hypothetical protein
MIFSIFEIEKINSQLAFTQNYLVTHSKIMLTYLIVGLKGKTNF